MKFGPGGAAPIEVRISGSDPKELRRLAEEAAARMAAANADLLHIRTDWREQELAITPVYSSDRAETAGVTRQDVADTLKYATDGVTAAQLREGDRLIPIVIRRDPASEIGLGDMVVYSSTANAVVPIAQALDGFSAQPVDTIVRRRQRLQTITVAADIPPDETAAAMRAPLVETIEAMELPLGYRIEWGGEHESSSDAQASLGTQLPLSLLVMVLISIFLFGALRQPIVIWLLVPMAVNGVVLGLLGTGLPFTFTALLGLAQLVGHVNQKRHCAG